MEKIEINEYVRTTDGKTDKVLVLLEDNICLEKHKWCSDKYIAKHSKDIIDLVEPGDVVEVLDIDWIRIFNIDNEDILVDFKEEIEEKNWKLLSILTKEQYKKNCYRVEE